MFSDKQNTGKEAVKDIDQCNSIKSNENHKETDIHEENIIKTEIAIDRKEVDVNIDVNLIKSEQLDVNIKSEYNYIGSNSEEADRSNESRIKSEELYTGYNKINKNVNIEAEVIHNEKVFGYVTEAIEHEATNCNGDQIKSEILDISYEKESNSDSDTSDGETLINVRNKTSDINNEVVDINKDHHKCSKCDFVTHTKNTLRRHTYYNHSRGYLNCSYCSYRTRYTTSIQRHINAKHTQSNVLKCSLCNYETYTESNLERHVNGKHTKRRSFNCPHCCHKTYYNSALLKHINSKHAKKVIFYCSECKFETYSRATLSYHVKLKHKNDLLNCLYCKYETCQKSNLNRHIKAKHPEAMSN